MTRFALDAAAALRLLDEQITVADGHQLVGPQLLRSQVLALLYRRHRAGGVDAAAARASLEALAQLRIRLLGDRVSRATAWKVALRHDAPDTAAAEYVAVATLQADALIALDPEVRALAEGEIALAGLEDLTRAP